MSGTRPTRNRLRRLTAEGYTYRLGGQPARGRAAMGAFLAAVHAAFPDWRVGIEEIVAEGDSVAVRWAGEVTHEGPFHGIPATGKRLSVSGINVYKVDGGVITEEWEQMDSLGMLQQMGGAACAQPAHGLVGAVSPPPAVCQVIFRAGLRFAHIDFPRAVRQE